VTPGHDEIASTHGEESGSYRAGEGPPLLLLHGLAMSWRAWRPLLASLRTDHQVIAPTLPGHRGGPAAPADVNVAWLADYLETMLDEDGHDRVHVVGNSLGGWLALELARRGRACSVTAVSPAGAWRNGFTSVAPLLPHGHVGPTARLAGSVQSAIAYGSDELVTIDGALLVRVTPAGHVSLVAHHGSQCGRLLQDATSVWLICASGPVRLPPP